MAVWEFWAAVDLEALVAVVWVALAAVETFTVQIHQQNIN
jgi:hypothetical protein